MQNMKLARNRQQRKPIFVHRNGKVHRIYPRGSHIHRRHSSRLLALPLELRRLIYREIVKARRMLKLRTLRPPPLALANRQLFHEVTEAVFEHNTLALDVLLRETIEGPPVSEVTYEQARINLRNAAKAAGSFRYTGGTSAPATAAERDLARSNQQEARRQVHRAQRALAYVADVKALGDRCVLPDIHGPQAWYFLLDNPSGIKKLRLQVLGMHSRSCMSFGELRVTVTAKRRPPLYKITGKLCSQRPEVQHGAEAFTDAAQRVELILNWIVARIDFDGFNRADIEDLKHAFGDSGGDYSRP